jgi:TonB family protein
VQITLMSVSPQDVYSTDELAAAAATPRAVIETLVERGELRLVAGTAYISGAEAERVGRLLVSGELRWADDARWRQPRTDLFEVKADGRIASTPTRHAVISAFAHAMVLCVALLLTTRTDAGATEEAVAEPARLVFIVSPGPGGGGGGGGLRNPLPAPKLQRRGPPRPAITVPAVTPTPALTTVRKEEPTPPPPTPALTPPPVEKVPEPLPAAPIVAPVVAVAANTQDREGVIDRARGDAASQGSGQGGGAGTGQGTGNGEGLGGGIGDGSGGGTGGGPFRPGSGIEAPRLLREVKADYTEEARRRNLAGDVVLEIVVRRDGSVGEVTLLRGLGAGLDQRAIAAVRQWRFDPARRRGQAVDVIVEVAVEFTLR